MAIRRQFPDVHWVWEGGISFVYEVHPHIVVKVPKSGDYEREQFRKELEIYEIFSHNPPCPSIVQCFFYADNGIFLEYMRGATTIGVLHFHLLIATLDVTLCSRIQNNHIRDDETDIITKVEKLEPLPLRKEWMNDLAQAVAFLESLNLAHGDLRPENILLDRDRLKLSDFDSTAKIGSEFEACIPPYGRILNSDEQDQGESGTAGSLGARTEQFALGSLYYFINYGFEVYGNQRLTEDYNKHGRKVVDLLQDMKFPQLDGDPLIDDIINKCWHNKYATIGELAAHTETLLPGRSNRRDIQAENTPARPWLTILGHPVRGFRKFLKSCWGILLCRTTRETTKPDGAMSEIPDGYTLGIEQHDSAKDFSFKRKLCQNLDRCGLLHVLSSDEPEQLGFKLEWYRHAKN